MQRMSAFMDTVYIYRMLVSRFDSHLCSQGLNLEKCEFLVRRVQSAKHWIFLS